MQTMTATEQREATYWDHQAARLSDADLAIADVSRHVLAQAVLRRLGKLDGVRLLDVGCGTGEWAVRLALLGARVWAIDISPVSIAAVRRRAALHGVADRVTAMVSSATELDFPPGFFDRVHGQNIIHHLDAARFGREIARVLRRDGCAVFHENCANNRLLMLARDRLCGRWGIPRWSSDDEYPLTRDRLERFARPFAQVQVDYPQFLFFHYLDAKLFGYRNRPVNWLCGSLDRAIHRFVPALRRFSYRQVICCRRPIGEHA